MDAVAAIQRWPRHRRACWRRWAAWYGLLYDCLLLLRSVDRSQGWAGIKLARPALHPASGTRWGSHGADRSGGLDRLTATTNRCLRLFVFLRCPRRAPSDQARI